MKKVILIITVVGIFSSILLAQNTKRTTQRVLPKSRNTKKIQQSVKYPFPVERDSEYTVDFPRKFETSQVLVEGITGRKLCITPRLFF